MVADSSAVLVGAGFAVGAVTAWALMRLWRDTQVPRGAAHRPLERRNSSTTSWKVTLDLKIRPLIADDFDKEFIPLLNQLSAVGSVSRDVRIRVRVAFFGLWKVWQKR